MLKKIIYLIVSGGLLLSGCSLDYEPLNGPSSGSFPASEEEAMAGLYAAYKGLANMTVKETPFPMRINDCISDIGTYRTGAGNQIKAMSSTLTADNTMCEKVWGVLISIPSVFAAGLYCLTLKEPVAPQDEYIKSAEASKDKPLPSVGTSLAPIILPLVLIFLNTGINAMFPDTAVAKVFKFVGSPLAALLAGCLFSLVLTGAESSITAKSIST